MNLLIIGGSQGLGHALAKGLQPIVTNLFILSRSQPQVLQQDPAFPARWIQADLRTPDFVTVLRQALHNTPLDVLIYNAGVWEPDAFMPTYDFATTSPAQISDLIQVNLTSAILSVQALLPNLGLPPSAQIILIGSSSGLDNNQSRAVAYQASKFGLRGLNNALRENLRGTTIRCSLLNLGDLSTRIAYEAGVSGVQQAVGYSLIPVQDVVSVVRCLCELTPASLIKELDLVGIMDQAV